LGRMGRILGRLGTDVGTDKMCKIVNVYRPWDGGTDNLGGEKGIPLNPKLEIRNPEDAQRAKMAQSDAERAVRDKQSHRPLPMG